MYVFMIAYVSTHQQHSTTPYKFYQILWTPPSSYKIKSSPPSSVPPLKHSTPKSRRCGRLFFWSRWRVFKKKSCGHNFPRSDLTRTRGWCLNHLGTNWLWMRRKMGLELLSAKQKLNLHKDGDLTTWKCDAFLSAKKHVVLLSWSSGLLHRCSHHWLNCIIWSLAFVSRLPKGKAIGVHVGEVHSVKLHLEISKGEPNQTKKPPAHNSNHTRHAFEENTLTFDKWVLCIIALKIKNSSFWLNALKIT